MRSVLYAINVKDKIIVSYETLFKAHTMKKTSCNFLEKKYQLFLLIINILGPVLMRMDMDPFHFLTDKY